MFRKVWKNKIDISIIGRATAPVESGRSAFDATPRRAHIKPTGILRRAPTT